jgi:hypothetical protein
MYHRMGYESFMAERQQEPVDLIAESIPYTLTPAIIIAKQDKRKALEVPDWVTSIFASSDINPSYAMSTVIIGMGQDQTAALLWYGLHRMSITGENNAAMFRRRLFDEIATHGRELAGMTVKPACWAIDAGGAQFDAAVAYADSSASLCGIPAFAFTGRGWKHYKPYGKTALPGLVREQCHGCMDRKQGRVIRWVAWNADYWKEVAQRAWLGEVGTPGTISLYHGSHTDLANQICGDRLLGKEEVGGQMVWNFTRIPGKNDFGDALAQVYALSAYSGIGTGGAVTVRGRKRYTAADLRR